MKIVIAPDSYKESLSAMEVATEIARGFKEVQPDAEYIKLPVADGGEGCVGRSEYGERSFAFPGLSQFGCRNGCDQGLELPGVHSGIDDVFLSGVTAREYGGARNCGRGCQSEKSLAKHVFIS